MNVVLDSNVLLLVNSLASAGVIWKGTNWLKDTWNLPGKYAPVVSVAAGLVLSAIVVHWIGGAPWATTIMYGLGLSGVTSLAYDTHKGLTAE